MSFTGRVIGRPMDEGLLYNSSHSYLFVVWRIVVPSFVPFIFCAAVHECVHDGGALFCLICFERSREMLGEER